MTLPRVTTEFTDFNLGLVTESGADVQAKIGVASAGPLTLQRYTRAADVGTLLVGGPLAAATAISLADASPVLAQRVATDVPGTVSAVTQTGTGLSVLTVSGSPTDAFDASVRVTHAQPSLDGTGAVIVTLGGVPQAERAVPVSGALTLDGTGLTLTFSDAALVVGDTYSFSSVAPAATLANVVGALTALLASRPKLRFVHVLGAATPALFAAVDSVLAEQYARNYLIHALLEARPMTAGETHSDYLAAIETQFAGLASNYLAVALDGGYFYNPLTRSQEVRNSAWKASGRRVTRPIGETAYRVKSGSLSGISGLRFDANTIGNSGRFVSLRSYDGRDGVYVSDWPMMSVEGSDYDNVSAREVINEAARAGYQCAIEAMGDSLPVDPTTGYILEAAAAAFEAFAVGRIQADAGRRGERGAGDSRPAGEHPLHEALCV